MEVIISVLFNGEYRVFKIRDDTLYIDFVNEVKGMWLELSKIISKFRYSVGPIQNCVLESGEDLRNMISICNLTSEKIVHVLVFQVSTLSQVDSTLSVSPITPIQTVGEQLFCTVSIPLIGSGLDHSNSVSLQSPTKVMKQSKIPFRCVESRRILGAQEEFCGFASLPSYDINPATIRKNLLSDQWQHIMEQGIGTVFLDVVVGFRKQVILHATRVGFTFNYVRNDSKYIHVECGSKFSQECSWFIKAGCNQGSMSFEIYKGTFVHSCLGSVDCGSRSRFGPKVISQLVEHDVRSNPDIRGKIVADLVRNNYGVTIPYHSVWRTVESARDKLFGSFQESYDNLRWYGHAVKSTNPGSIFDLEVNNRNNRFERLFVAFDACLKGFQSCRPMLFLDGTFLHGRTKRILLTATAKDGNNGLFPIAFGIVSAENIDNWK